MICGPVGPPPKWQQELQAEIDERWELGHDKDALPEGLEHAQAMNRYNLIREKRGEAPLPLPTPAREALERHRKAVEERAPGGRQGSPYYFRKMAEAREEHYTREARREVDCLETLEPYTYREFSEEAFKDWFLYGHPMEP